MQSPEVTLCGRCYAIIQELSCLSIFLSCLSIFQSSQRLIPLHFTRSYKVTCATNSDMVSDCDWIWEFVGFVSPRSDIPGDLGAERQATTSVVSWGQVHSEHRFPAPSSKLCQKWLLHWRGTLYLRAAVRRRWQRPPKAFGTSKTVEAT